MSSSTDDEAPAAQDQSNPGEAAAISEKRQKKEDRLRRAASFGAYVTVGVNALAVVMLIAAPMWSAFALLLYVGGHWIRFRSIGR
jgi:hypothetical protein